MSKKRRKKKQPTSASTATQSPKPAEEDANEGAADEGDAAGDEGGNDDGGDPTDDDGGSTDDDRDLTDDDDGAEADEPTPKPPKALVRDRAPASPIDVKTARLLAAAGLIGLAGLHRFYMRRPVSGFLFLVTFGFMGLGTLIDLITMQSLCKASEGLDSEPVSFAPRRDEHETPTIRKLKWLDHGFGLAETVFLVVCLMGLIGVASAQAVSMKVYHKSWAWSFDVIRYSVFFIAMTGAALAAQQERQISMDFVSLNVSAWRRARLRFAIRLFVIVICVILYYGGMRLREITSGAYELVPPKLGISALPVGALLIAFHMAMHNIIDILYWIGGHEPPEPEHSAV